MIEYGIDYQDIHDSQDDTERPIPGHPDYFVTADGEIISHRRLRRRVLRPIAGKCAPRVDLDGKRYRVDWLIASAFLPGPPARYIHHIDGDLANNRPDNLRWSNTPQPRKRYQIEPRTGADAWRAKPIVQLDRRRNTVAIHPSAVLAADALCSSGIQAKAKTIRRAARGERPSAYGFYWRWVR